MSLLELTGVFILGYWLLNIFILSFSPELLTEMNNVVKEEIDLKGGFANKIIIPAINIFVLCNTLVVVMIIDFIWRDSE